MIDLNRIVKHSKVCSECLGFRTRKEAGGGKSVRAQNLTAAKLHIANREVIT